MSSFAPHHLKAQYHVLRAGILNSPVYCLINCSVCLPNPPSRRTLTFCKYILQIRPRAKGAFNKMLKAPSPDIDTDKLSLTSFRRATQSGLAGERRPDITGASSLVEITAVAAAPGYDLVFLENLPASTLARVPCISFRAVSPRPQSPRKHRRFP